MQKPRNPLQSVSASRNPISETQTAPHRVATIASRNTRRLLSMCRAARRSTNMEATIHGERVGVSRNTPSVVSHERTINLGFECVGCLRPEHGAVSVPLALHSKRSPESTQSTRSVLYSNAETRQERAVNSVSESRNGSRHESVDTTNCDEYLQPPYPSRLSLSPSPSVYDSPATQNPVPKPRARA